MRKLAEDDRITTEQKGLLERCRVKEERGKLQKTVIYL